MNPDESMGRIYNFLEIIMELLVLNLVWIVFNIPVIYMFMNLLLIKNLNELVTILIAIIPLLPLFFFPATTAMFAVIRKWIINKRDIGIIYLFRKYYKENYVKSMLGGFMIEVIYAIFVLDYYFFTMFISKALGYFLGFLFIFLLIFTLHFFSTLVHFDLKLFGSLKNAFLVTIGKPFFGIGVIILNVIIIYISKQFIFLILLFTGSLIALVSFAGFYKIYLTIQSKRKQSIDFS